MCNSMHFIFSMCAVCNFLYLINSDINFSQIKPFYYKPNRITNIFWMVKYFDSSYLTTYSHVENIFIYNWNSPNEIYNFLYAKFSLVMVWLSINYKFYWFKWEKDAVQDKLARKIYSSDKIWYLHLILNFLEILSAFLNTKHET